MAKKTDKITSEAFGPVFSPVFEEVPKVEHKSVNHDKVFSEAIGSMIYIGSNRNILIIFHHVKEAEARLAANTDKLNSIIKFENLISQSPSRANVSAANSMVKELTWLRQDILRTFIRDNEHPAKHGKISLESSASIVGFHEHNKKAFWAKVPGTKSAFVCILGEGFFKGNKPNAEEAFKSSVRELRGLKMYQEIYEAAYRQSKRYAENHDQKIRDLVRVMRASSYVHSMVLTMSINNAFDIYKEYRASKKAYEERAEVARKEAMKKNNERLVSILEEALLEIGDSDLSRYILGMAAGMGPDVWELIKKHATPEEMQRIEMTLHSHPKAHPFMGEGSVSSIR